MPTAIDQRRLRNGAEAAALPEVSALEQKKRQLWHLHDGVCALQSLNDLGSPEENQRAWDDMCALQKRYDKLKDEIAEMERHAEPPL